MNLNLTQIVKRFDTQSGIYVVLFLGTHFVFRLFNWPIYTIIYILFTLIFCLSNIVSFFWHKKKKHSWDFRYLFVILLYFFIYVKFDYGYFNLVIVAGLLISILIINKRLNYEKTSRIHARFVLLFSINILLLLTPNVTILKYINSTDTTIWRKSITWNSFKGPEPKNIGISVARIITRIHWKYNHSLNYPRVISVAVMSDANSWVDPDYNIYLDNLLSHEKLHFDITEWTRREFQDSINKHFFLSYKEAYSIYDHFQTINDSRHSEYDSISRHGVDFVGQIKWNKHLKEKLDE